MTAAASGAGLLLFLWLRGSDPNRVAISIDRSSVRSLDSLLTAGVTNEILRHMPSLTVETSGSRRAHYRVSLSTRLDGDSLLLTLRVADVANRRLRSDVVTVDRRVPESGAHLAGERVLIAIAADRNPRMQHWAPAAAIPNRWDAFQALEEGIAQPALHDSVAWTWFDRAAALDPTSATPRLWKAMSLVPSPDAAAKVDSALGGVTSAQLRLGEWDRTMLRATRALAHYDWTNTYAAGYSVLEASPGSEFAVIPALGALNLGRAREALELLKRMPPPDRSWADAWSWFVRAQALYMLGDHATLLATAEERLRANPEDEQASQQAVKALARLGRPAEAEAICYRALTRRLGYQPCLQAVIELRGRGFREAARRIGDRWAAALKADDTTSAEGYRDARILLAGDLGEWSEVEQLVSQAPPASIEPWLLLFAKAKAARGDRAAVTAILDRLPPTTRPSTFDRAEIAALLGDKQEATELVAQGFREGWRRGFTLYVFAGLDGLQGYQPFDSLVRPIDGPGRANDLAVRSPSRLESPSRSFVSTLNR